MKKFLFTLASLFVASSAFANSYFFMDKVEITEDMVGQEITLTVGADFRELVSAFELWITMPEGLEVVDFETGADMKGMKYYNVRGREMSVDAAVTTIDMMHFVGITSATTTGYYQDETGTWVPYGAIKWLPGVYEEMIILYVQVNAVPTEDVTLRTEPGCGQDPRADQYGGRAVPEGGANLPWGERLPEDTPTLKDCESPSVMGATGENGTYYIQITPDPATDGALQYTVDVEPVSTETIDGIVYLYYNRGAEDVTVHVEAWTNEGTEYNASEKEIKDIVVPKLPQVATPVVTFTGGNGTIYVSATCATEGATVVLYDPEGNAVDMPAEVNYDIYEGYDATWTATATAPNMLPSATGENHIVIAADQKATVESPSIMGYNDEDGVHFNIVITPDPATDGVLEFTADPMPGAKAETLVYTRGDADYTVHVEARTKEGATCQASDWEIKDITVPALGKTAKPSVTYSYENGELNVWAYGSDDDAVYTLYCDGVEYTGEMPITFDIYEGYNHTWTATALAPNKQVSDLSDPCVINIPAEQKVYTTPDPVIGEPVVVDDNTVTVTVTGQGNIVVTVTTYDENGNAVTETYTGRDEVVVPFTRGENDEFVQISATATADLPEGYDVVAPGQATEPYVVIPAKPVVPQTAMPDYTITEGVSSYVYLTDENGNIIYAPDGKPAAALDENGNRIIDENGHWKEVTFTNMDEDDAVIEYRIDGGEWFVWDGEPLNFANDGTYVVEVRATAAGKTVSEVNTVTVVITPKTGVNELVNGKAVAGVRYFNMAGQEMQEANGVTIVVTTYTDGTTSAVKVMK